MKGEESRRDRLEQMAGGNYFLDGRESIPGASVRGSLLFGEGEGISHVTVFGGQPGDWRRYLAVSWEHRVEVGWMMELRVMGRGHVKVVNGVRGLRSAALELSDLFEEARNKVEGCGEDLLTVYEGLVSGGEVRKGGSQLMVGCSELLPCEAVREVMFSADGGILKQRIVVSRRFFKEVESLREEFGVVGWLPLLGVLLLQMGHCLRPRDHFMERIGLTARWANLMLHTLCEGKSGGRLILTGWGKFLRKLARGKDEEKGVASEWARQVMGLVEGVGFLFGRKNSRELDEAGEVVVRDYLDRVYLRLSIEGLMPTVPEWLVPIDFGGDEPVGLPKPRVGRYGVLDEEDLEAWKLVAGPLRDQGLLVLGQLGIGQFGRVYEAYNLRGGHYPERVAVKVDRFRKGRKKEAIEAAETIMETARGLVASPHVIRVFDAGRLRKLRMTYHVLQLVDGDTLDHLLGMAGEEHASVLRPREVNRSREAAVREVFKALSGHRGEAWRKRRQAHPFRRRPRVGEVLDLLVSLMLWLERVHELGFAVNDLKNGNVMVSRRGQVKGIDLDSYGRIFSGGDKLGDFIFLAVGVFQMLKRVLDWGGRGWSVEDGLSFLGDVEGMKKLLLGTLFSSEAEGTEGGTGGEEALANFLANFLASCWSGDFCDDARGFSEAIDELIFLRRRLEGRELVIH